MYCAGSSHYVAVEVRDTKKIVAVVGGILRLEPTAYQILSGSAACQSERSV